MHEHEYRVSVRFDEYSSVLSLPDARIPLVYRIESLNFDDRSSTLLLDFGGRYAHFESI